MLQRLITVYALLWPFAPQISAETTEGKIRAVGTWVNQQVIIKTANQNIQICPDSTRFKELFAFDAMHVRVEGDVKQLKKKACFAVTNYELISTATGHLPVTGVLSRHKNGYKIVVGDRTFKLANLLPGMSVQIGKKIIVAVDKNTALSDSKSITLLSYMPYPKR